MIELLIEIERYINDNSSDLLRTPNGIVISLPKLNEKIYLRPVCSKAFHFGSLAIQGANFSDLDKVAISQICNALSITILSHISISQQQERLRTDFVRDLLSGHCQENDVLLRGNTLQCDITHITGVIMLEMQKIVSENHLADQFFALQGSMYEQVRNELSSLSPDSICANFSGVVVILYVENHIEQQNAVQTARFLQRSLQESLSRDIIVGIGLPCKTFYDIPNSYNTAQMALCIANSTLVPLHFAVAEDVPAYIALLNSCTIKPLEISNIVDHLLKPIREYDKRHNAELERTFRLLLEMDMDYAQIAEELFLHKNTVLQRKQKIISLYRDDPFGLPMRRQFELAFLMESFYLNFQRTEDIQ